MNQDSANPLQARLDRAERKIALLERMIEENSRQLFFSHEETKQAHRFLTDVQDALPVALLVVQKDGLIAAANPLACAMTDYPREQLLGGNVDRLFDRDLLDRGAATATQHEANWRTATDAEIPVLMSVRAMPSEAGDRTNFVCIGVDLRERRRLEVQLRLSQKLESIGQLAAGIAHELNTPIQFVGDSVHFLAESYDAIWGLLQRYRDYLAESNETKREGLAEAIAEQETEAQYLAENVPPAIERTHKGLERIAGIVHAMRALSHPSQRQPVPTDLHKAIDTVLIVSRNEYKYVADVRTEFDDIGEIECVPDDLHQILLNLVVNAAHAIADHHGPRGTRGTIVIRTRRAENLVELSVADDGCGIPESIRDRIFDAFFTTKEPGRGTGQGLAIVHALVARHGGSLSLESEVGRGTTFFIRLPLEVPQERRTAA
ncbi:MAG: PAS domain-containing protein [Candidatus Eisenbacteria bacterium]|nr:PAS domain-containing protein [Candidatus Eisenbacteria bacterium]